MTVQISEEEKAEFLRHQTRYMNASLEVNNARRTIEQKLKEVLDITQEMTGENQPMLQRERLRLSAACSDKLHELGEAHQTLAEALYKQASALRMTAYVGNSIMDKVEEAPGTVTEPKE